MQIYRQGIGRKQFVVHRAVKIKITFTEGRDTGNSWRTMNHFGSSNIPLMADALWLTGRPESHDLPPEMEGQIGRENVQPDFNHFDLPGFPAMPGGLPEPRSVLTPEQEQWWAIDTSDQMRRFCVDRHRKRTNVLFMDGTVRSISPKQL